MPRREYADVPLWKQALAPLILAYALVAWALPVLLLPFVTVLPLVHERTFLERLPFSVFGSLVVIAAMVVLNGGRRPGRPVAGSAREALGFWIGVSAGFALFTIAGAALSANIFGPLAKILPGEAFAVQVSVEAADYSGSRRPSLGLDYRDPRTGTPRYVTLSKRLFDYPMLRPGDVIQLRGRSTLAGQYIEEIAFVR